MRRRRGSRWALSNKLTLLAPFLFGATIAPAAANQPESPRAFVARVYRPYLHDPMAGHDIAWVDRDIFSRDFLRLVRADQKLADGEEGYIDADPICACQDWGRFSYEVIGVRGSAARRFVIIRLHNWGQVHDITLILVPDRRGSFRIDDLHDDIYRPSFKVWMTKALRSGSLR